jgi:hypothetical protein
MNINQAFEDIKNNTSLINDKKENTLEDLIKLFIITNKESFKVYNNLFSNNIWEKYEYEKKRLFLYQNELKKRQELYQKYYNTRIEIDNIREQLKEINKNVPELKLKEIIYSSLWNKRNKNEELIKWAYHNKYYFEKTKVPNLEKFFKKIIDNLPEINISCGLINQNNENYLIFPFSTKHYEYNPLIEKIINHLKNKRVIDLKEDIKDCEYLILEIDKNNNIINQINEINLKIKEYKTNIFLIPLNIINQNEIIKNDNNSIYEDAINIYEKIRHKNPYIGRDSIKRNISFLMKIGNCDFLNTYIKEKWCINEKRNAKGPNILKHFMEDLISYCKKYKGVNSYTFAFEEMEQITSKFAIVMNLSNIKRDGEFYIRNIFENNNYSDYKKNEKIIISDKKEIGHTSKTWGFEYFFQLCEVWNAINYYNKNKNMSLYKD